VKKKILLNKKEGETPLMLLDSFRRKNPKYRDVKITYAGRLDPMASGLMLFLTGEEIKNKEKYLGLEKEYEFEVLFGFATDTYDILGKVTSLPQRQDLWGKGELRESIKQNLKYFEGDFLQKYPFYSSPTIKHVRAGKQPLIQSHKVSVKKLQFLKLRTINSETLLKNIEKRVAKVNGDFRQEEILKLWHKKLREDSRKYFIGSFRVRCGSGMYVRALSHDLGQNMGVPTLAYSIKRTKIGKWKL